MNARPVFDHYQVQVKENSHGLRLQRRIRSSLLFCVSGIVGVGD